MINYFTSAPISLIARLKIHLPLQNEPTEKMLLTRQKYSGFLVFPFFVFLLLFAHCQKQRDTLFARLSLPMFIVFTISQISHHWTNFNELFRK